MLSCFVLQGFVYLNKCIWFRRQQGSWRCLWTPFWSARGCREVEVAENARIKFVELEESSKSSVTNSVPLNENKGIHILFKKVLLISKLLKLFEFIMNVCKNVILPNNEAEEGEYGKDTTYYENLLIRLQWNSVQTF